MLVTMTMLCQECHEHTTFKSLSINQGDNTMDLTCSQCGEIYHVSYHIPELDRLIVRDLEIRRMLGVMRDSHFFSKETLQ